MKSEDILIELNTLSKNTLMETLGIVFTDFTGDTLTAEMVVESTVHQPMGFLHGGASLAMAESVGSLLSMTSVDTKKYYVFGTQVTGYHIKAVRHGKIRAVASFINKGKNTQVVEINLYNETRDTTFKNGYATMTNRIVAKKDFK